MKKVQVNTPLILEQNGELVRIETGSVIELADDVYNDVSAHTTLLDEGQGEPAVEAVAVAEVAESETDTVAESETDTVAEVVEDEVVANEETTDTSKKSNRKKA